ncbi:biliverdin-producing heme oxygenase [Paenibacillus sp. JX-17]|uniref:Biliverdin-producing heme oxygenase n=1 Tax=Paenibacillus lacisoli TaxID=3064525 RepID=A0ABT9CGA0_9BACL|nr:biliverdin-producing heme oxygenase [Paenibacillus sp. JX-17]MDO7908309.1 biliverdin-producing heme oxygenase [Paenibacillus sp. JX-17]
MTTSIMERLRDETAPYHDQVERNRYAKGIMSQDITQEDYRIYLEKFHGFMKPLEAKAAAQAASESGMDLDIRAKTPLLEQDLRYLGLTEEQIQQLPECGSLPDMSIPARLLGCFYVMEGSTLGGQIITRQLMKFMPLTAEQGIQYFNGYGEQTRDRWGEFRELVLSKCVTVEEEEAAVDAAKETFRLLDEWLNA